MIVSNVTSAILSPFFSVLNVIVTYSLLKTFNSEYLFVAPEKNITEGKYNLIVNDIPRCTRDEYIRIYIYTYSQTHANESIYLYDNIHK